MTQMSRPRPRTCSSRTRPSTHSNDSINASLCRCFANLWCALYLNVTNLQNEF